MTKLISPQPGNVKIQVSIISFTTPKLMADKRFTAPTPMMALVLVWVVETGIPNRLDASRQRAPATSAENALVTLQLHHIHAHRFDNFFSSDTGSQSHHRAAKQHQPYRNQHAADRTLSIGKGDSQKQNADEFLAILRAVHEAHGCRSGDLRPGKKSIRQAPFHISAQDGDGLTYHESQYESQDQAENQSIDHFDPFRAVDPADSMLNRDSRAGRSGNQTVAFTGRNAENRRCPHCKLR